MVNGQPEADNAAAGRATVDRPESGGGDAAPAVDSYRWVAMFVVLFGTFMVVLDTTVVNLGLPSLQREFDIDQGIEWVVTSYLAAVGVAQTTSGWLADRFGRKKTFINAMALFTAASLLCSLSLSFEMLIGARVLQGIGGGLLMPVAMAMIYELFEPTERGRALGYFGIAIMVAPAVGPVIGGSLVSSLSWRWLFLINLPIGLVGLPVAMRLLRDTGFKQARPFDRTGLVLSATGLVAFLVGISQGAIWGWSSPSIVALLLIGVTFITVFVRHAQRVENPLVELSILSRPIFGISMMAIGLMSIAQFTRLVYIPLELGALRGITEIRIGLVMLPSAVGMAATMPIGGRLVDRLGARLPVTVGAGVLGLSFLALSRLDLTTPLPMIAAILFVGGLGSGLAMMAPNIVAMNSIEGSRVSQASGLSNITRQVSAATGVAVLSSVFASVRSSGDPAAMAAGDALRPYQSVFLIAFGLLMVTVIVAQFLPAKAKAIELQQLRAAERNAGISTPSMEPAES